jgi:ComF family protein
LKYEGHKEVGVAIGEWMGMELKNGEGFQDIDLIVPVPLHPSRQSKRGYNQSAVFAQGLSAKMGIPFEEALSRNVATSTQTKKHRFERSKNVESAFSLKDNISLKNKHILLVDDVITTGSTLISCGETILNESGARVSIATIAYA